MKTMFTISEKDDLGFMPLKGMVLGSTNTVPYIPVKNVYTVEDVRETATGWTAILSQELEAMT